MTTLRIIGHDFTITQGEFEMASHVGHEREVKAVIDNRTHRG